MNIKGLDSFPRVKVAHVPTPLEDMPNLTRTLDGPKLFVKRDDLTGVAFGGNKARQLEYYFGEAKKSGADTILITGAVQSNYVRMTAAVSNKLGMQCHIQLEDRVPDVDELYRTSGNVLLDKLLGAQLHFYPEGEDEEGADLSLDELAKSLQRQGAIPYVIHLGPGHPPLGALGYIDAAAELLKQIKEMDLSIHEILIASGSGLTHSGLLFGLRALGSPIRVIGNCHRRNKDYQRKRISDVLQGISNLLDIPSPAKEEDIHLFDGAVGPGYGQMDQSTREAILLAASNEALFCDPVYSGKAMAGLIALVRQNYFNKKNSVLFWHTGGQPAIFAYGEKILKDL